MKPGQMLSAMLLLCVQGHDGQFDKSGRPYILHTLTVMHKMRTDDEELQCGGVGHDIIEDGKINGKRVTYQDLRDIGMTPRVVEMIRCLTKVPGETEEEYKAKVMSNPDSRRAKKADLQHNSDIRRLKGVTAKDVERTVKYHQFYLELVEMDKQEANAAVA